MNRQGQTAEVSALASFAKKRNFHGTKNHVSFLQIEVHTMSAHAKPVTIRPQAAAVLSKAVTRAADRLAVSKTLLAKILGVSPPTVSRLYGGAYLLDQNRKEWDFALLFVRVFRSLDSIVGDDATARQWLCSENLALHGKPIELICNTEGLVRVVQYLDASRGRI